MLVRGGAHIELTSYLRDDDNARIGLRGTIGSTTSGPWHSVGMMGCHGAEQHGDETPHLVWDAGPQILRL
jgi:hypothetical protein